MKYVSKSVANCYILAIILSVVAAVSGQTTDAGKRAALEFEGRAKEYTKRREAIEQTLPALPKQASAEQIAAHKDALLRSVSEDRKVVVKGNIFTPAAEAHIRSVIAAYAKGREGAQLKKELTEAENKTVHVKVNIAYPESAELLEMPPSLLLELPQLPKQLRYRFVGTNLLLVDRENQLIIDYMTNALP
jgi:hypothetical protein